jgi:hypothetical protein
MPEIFLDVAVSLFGFVLVLSHLIGRRAKREETWPHLQHRKKR